jgi:hypothetical protein
LLDADRLPFCELFALEAYVYVGSVVSGVSLPAATEGELSSLGFEGVVLISIFH